MIDSIWMNTSCALEGETLDRRLMTLRSKYIVHETDEALSNLFPFSFAMKKESVVNFEIGNKFPEIEPSLWEGRTRYDREAHLVGY